MGFHSLVICSLALILVFTRPSYAAEQPKNLDAAVEEIKTMFSKGYTRFEIAKRVTAIADTQIKNNNGLEGAADFAGKIMGYETDKERDFDEWRSSGGLNKPYDETAEWAWRRRAGQCNENSALVYYLLKKAGAKNLSMYENSSPNHAYTVWGLDSEDDPTKRHNWTDDVIIPDSWTGTTLRGWEAFHNKYYADKNEFTHIRDTSIKPRCGILDRTNGLKKVPACPFPPECHENIYAIHIGDSCYSCGHRNERCCDNNRCAKSLKCSNSVCIAITDTADDHSTDSTSQEDANSEKACADLQSEFDDAVANKKYNTASSFLYRAHNCGWVTKDQDTNNLNLDSDKDGVTDANDLCAGTPAGMPVNSTGCSGSQLDADNDTISDAVDTCPDTPAGETADTKGCSDSQRDSDKDTVSDAVDTCPDTPTGETADTKGCSDSQRDSDKDTASDAVDTCPDTPAGETVDPKGCSESQLAELNRKKKCPADTVKLSDDSGINQCVPCSDLRQEFDAAVTGNDHDYAQSLLAFAPNCNWNVEGRKKLSRAKLCPENTVKLSAGNGENQCVSCSELQGDYIAAQASGDNDYARTLVDLSGECGWAQDVATQLGYEAMMADLDQRCQEQLLFSHAVISGDRYHCVCGDGLTVFTRNGSSACQNCEQVRGEINSALGKNNINAVRGLMNGAQSCGWYDDAVQLVADINRYEQEQEDQRRRSAIRKLAAYSQQFTNQHNANMNQSAEDSRRYNQWLSNKNRRVSLPQHKNLPPRQSVTKSNKRPTCPPGTKESSYGSSKCYVVSTLSPYGMTKCSGKYTGFELTKGGRCAEYVRKK